MLFGRKKKEDEAASAAPQIPAPAPAAPTPSPVRAAATIPAPAPVEPATAPVAVPTPPASVTVTPDYANARVVAANHIIVNAGQGKLVLDVARELSGGNDKQMPVDTRVVMTVATAQRLQAALAQALAAAK